MALPISPDRGVGHIVAIEGSADLVSTQLRLLAPSRKILILPSLQHYLGNINTDESLQVPELILRYHTAAQARHTEALEFLRHPTSRDENRLVLMHGGTMSAHVACLSTIMEHDTDCDVEEAHATLIRLANNGVTGLRSARSSYHQADAPPSKEHENLRRAKSTREQGQRSECGGTMDAGGDTFEDRIIRAMRAADALDRETEFLQPATPDVDLTVKLIDIPSRSRKRPDSTVVERPETLRGPSPPSPAGHQPRVPTEPVPRVSHDMRPREAAVSAASRKPPLRIRIPSPPIPWAGDVAAGGDPQAPNAVPPRGSEGPGHRRSRTAESNLSPRQTSTRDGSSQGRTGVPGLDSQLCTVSPEHDEDQAHPEGRSRPTKTEETPFEPVLPLLEDLVVFFTPETPDGLQDFVFRRLSETCKAPRPSIPGPDTFQHDTYQGARRLAVRDCQKGGQKQFEDGHVNGAVPWVRKDLVHGLPTPNHSPNPLGTAPVAVSSPSTRLFSISVGEETAVSIQNFLRSFLASQFPLQGRRFSTADGTEFPTEPGLWRALECDGNVATPEGESRLDLILAVGAESTVTKNRLSEVVGQLEKLGFKTSGLSRSGRVDIRYLIANAMQSFTAQPLTKQTQSNPFADRALLAALIIPHLETYLAAHPDVRFLLIEYPSEHLPTVLALQTLIGTEMMKVVGIINSDDSPQTQSLSVSDTDRRPSEGFRSLNRRGSGASGAFVGPCSFSKANFLLASSATGFETAAFVAAIRESLISISDYYIPERPLYKHPAPQTPPRKTQSTNPSVNANSLPVPQQNEPTRVSVSTLIITPPSSPTEPSPPAQAHSPPRYHVNPRSIPPRSSSASASPPSRGRQPGHAPDPAYTHDSSSSSEAGRIRWTKINYASSPPSTSTIAHPSSHRINHSDTARSRHRHQYSDPLSPRGFPSAPTTAATPPTSTSEPKGRPDFPSLLSSDEDEDEDEGGGHQGADKRRKETEQEQEEDKEDEDEDDEVQDAEERRLMPLYLRRREDVEKGRSTKALRWLGLV